jgi:hypothetical protein
MSIPALLCRKEFWLARVKTLILTACASLWKLYLRKTHVSTALGSSRPGMLWLDGTRYYEYCWWITFLEA